MHLHDLLEQARDGIFTHRLRATLSSIGIVVGVGTVVASLAIGEGARRSAMAEISGLGIDNIYVRAALDTPTPGGRAAAPVLTDADALAIRDGVAGVGFVSTS